MFTCLLVFLGLSVTAQLTIILESIPPDTPEGSTIYIAGDFQGWNPADPQYALALNDDGLHSITFLPDVSSMSFKFTRGSWPTVEGNAQGGYIPNRSYSYNGLDTLWLTILGWEDLGASSSTATEQVHLLDDDFFMPQLDRSRRIWIYLPPDYDEGSEHYPVLYMHDGQNLFDEILAFSGEWEVDETLDELHDMGDPGIIVVGIENGGVHRIDEYSPWVNNDYGGGEGGAYMDFIVNTLKPHVDSNYRTLQDRLNTGIMGSSLGGLISQYAIIEHQDIFSKAGIFSPSYWFVEECFDIIDDNPFSGEETRIYHIMGIPEGQVHVDNVLAMESALLDAGYPEADLNTILHTDGQHSEWYWAREFGAAYQWLFADAVDLEEQKSLELVLRPNPVRDRLRLKGDKDWNETCDSLVILNTMGERLMDFQTPEQSMDVSFLNPGFYLLRVDWTDGTSSILRFVKE